MKIHFTYTKIYFDDLLFDIASIMYLLLTILDFSVIDVSRFFMPISLLIISALFFRMFLIKFPQKQMIFVMIVASITILSYFSSGRSWFYPYSMIFVICGYRINYKHVAKVYLITIVTILALIILLSNTGIISNNIFYRIDPFSHELVQRQSLGFKNVNSLATIAFQVIILLLLISGNKVSVKTGVMCIALMSAIYYITRNITLLIISVILFILYFLWKRLNLKTYKIFLSIASISPVVLAILSIVSVIRYDENSKFWKMISTLLSRRIELWAEVYHKYGLKLFGSNIAFDQSTEMRYILDNAYLQLAIRYGIIVFVIFVLLLWLLNIWAVAQEKYYIAILAVAMSIVGFMETAMIILCMNTTLMYISEILYNPTKVNRQLTDGRR